MTILDTGDPSAPAPAELDDTPGETRPDPRAETLRRVLQPMVGRQHAATANVADLVRRLEQEGKLHGTPTRMLRSLLHMQANRLHGISREREHLAAGLWTLAVRAIANRPVRR